MEKDFVAGYYSGTSGLLLPVPNNLFYPEKFRDKSRLCFYGSMMNSIEINSSFYKVPKVTTVSKWANDVHAGFEFTFKLSKEITHNKALAFNPETVKYFMEVIDLAAEKKGCLLVQFPPSIRIAQLRQLALLMKVLLENDPIEQLNIALEFRHVSLYQQDVYQLLDEYGMGLVIQDKPTAATPLMDTKRGFIYLGFHGPKGSYKGSYTDEFLYEYAGYIRDWIAEGKKVYSYFNNTMGSAVSNLLTLKGLVRSGDSGLLSY